MKCRPGIVFFVLAAAFSSCRNNKPAYLSFNGFAQGTTYSIVYENSPNISAEKMKSGVERILHDFDMSLSLYQDSSVVSRINRNEAFNTDLYFEEVFAKSKAIFQLTNGAFDVTVGPLVRAWGFGPDARKNFSESKRDSLLNLIGMGKVDIKDGIFVKDDPRINLDFNAIAQGYSVDVIFRHLNDLGIKSYLVEIGGEVRVRGKKGDVLWRIGIDRPTDDNMLPGNDLQAVISLKDRALATSGNYRKFYMEDGIKYSHTIDPKTGYPVRNKLLSATVLADECADADGIATAFMVMGMEKSIEFLYLHPGFEAFLVYSDENGNFRTWVSEKLKGYISEQ